MFFIKIMIKQMRVLPIWLALREHVEEQGSEQAKACGHGWAGGMWRDVKVHGSRGTRASGRSGRHTGVWRPKA